MNSSPPDLQHRLESKWQKRKEKGHGCSSERSGFLIQQMDVPIAHIMWTHTQIFRTHYSSAQCFAPAPHFTEARSQGSYDVLISWSNDLLASVLFCALPFLQRFCCNYPPSLLSVVPSSLRPILTPFFKTASSLLPVLQTSLILFYIFLRSHLSPSKLLYCWFSGSSWIVGSERTEILIPSGLNSVWPDLAVQKACDE